MGRPGSRLPTSRGSTRPHPVETRRIRRPRVMDTPSCFVGYPWKCRRPRRSRSRRRICVADEVCVRTDSSCTRTSLRRGIGPRPEDRPAVPRGVHAVRTVGSTKLVVGFVRGERRGRGDSRRSSRRCRPIGESSDYQTSTPSPRLIRALRILTKRCRGAGVVPRTPRRGAAMAARVSLRARRHRMLGFGGGGIDGGVSADCVAEALLLRGLVLLASRV